MGITGAPMAFCEMLAARLHDLLVTYFMELFMDDGGCTPDTFRDMMDMLAIIFTWFRECGFSIASGKTKFCVSEMEFAGGTIGQGEVKPDLTKLMAIVNWLRPVNVMGLMSFLGLTEFYRS